MASGIRELASIEKTAQGTPRFVMQLPEARMKDPGLAYLWRHETQWGGYEYATRRFIEQHLQAGDLFIDVGAHWGLFSLQAATHPVGDIRVLAIEPHPDNLCWLDRQLQHNGVADQVEIVAAAAGGTGGTAPLVMNSTMGHSLYGKGLPSKAPKNRSITVPLVGIDQLLAARSDIAGRSVILKIDVEGFEPEVLESADGLLQSGRLRAVIFEKGSGYASAEGQAAFGRMTDQLQGHGYRLWRFAHPDLGGKLLPYTYSREGYNVFALAPDEEPKPVYAKSNPVVLPLNGINKPPTAPEIVRATTRAMIEAKTTDAARWADPDILEAGAAARAEKAASWIKPGETVMDVGSGLCRLHRLLPKECGYARADLAAMGPKTQIVDLNEGDFPKGQFDHIALLAVLEYMHDPEAVLKRARQVADNLILTYTCRRAEDSTRERRSQAMVSDLTYDDLVRMLDRSGWALHYSDGEIKDRLFIAKGKSA